MKRVSAFARVCEKIHQSPNCALLFTVLLALLIRAQILIAAPPILRYDSIDYIKAAFQIGATGRYQDPQLAPLYPFMLHILTVLLGRNHLALLLVQHALDIGSVALVYFTARQLFKSQWVALVAGTAVAIDFTLAQYANMVLTETLFFFCVNLFMFTFVTAYQKDSIRRYALLGFVIAITQLVRPVASLLIICIPIGLMLAKLRTRQVLKPTAACAGAWLVCIALSRLLLPAPGNTTGIMLYYRVVNLAHLTASESSAFDLLAPYAEGTNAGYGVVLGKLITEKGMSRDVAEGVMRKAALAAIQEHPIAFMKAQFSATMYLLNRSYFDKFRSIRWINIDYYIGQLNQYATPELVDYFPVYGDRHYSQVMTSRIQRAGVALAPFIFPLFVFSILLYIIRKWRKEKPLILPLVVIGYFTLVIITFNAPQDRYRASFDSLIYLVIAYGLIETITLCYNIIYRTIGRRHASLKGSV